MRLSVERGDIGHKDYVLNMHKDIKVYLDGKNVTENCITADEEEGFVKLISRNDLGKLYVKDGELATECLKGKVSITMDERD